MEKTKKVLRAPVWICPICSCVKRFSEWVPYQEVREHLQSHASEWTQVSEFCPTHKTQESKLCA